MANPHTIAADRRPRRPSATLAVVLASLVAGGCGIIGTGPVANVKSADPAERITGIKVAADRHDYAALPDIVHSLESEDPAERMYAIEGLRRMTGQTFGYRHYDDPEQREPAVGRWKEWLKTRPAKP